MSQERQEASRSCKRQGEMVPHSLQTGTHPCQNLDVTVKPTSDIQSALLKDDYFYCFNPLSL